MFWLSMALFGYLYAQREQGQTLFILIALFVLIAFVSILCHELGHALTGRKFSGYRPEISLVAFGGLASFPGASFTKWKHVIMVAAGPFTNFLLAALFFVATLFLLPHLDPDGSTLLTKFFSLGLVINIIWGIFNLIPVFPLDGGQIMHSFIRNQHLAHTISLVIAILMIAWGISMGAIFMVMLFAFMGYQNYEIMQAIRPRR